MKVTSVRDFIVTYENVLDVSLCEEIIKKFESDSSKAPGLEITPDGTRGPGENKISVDLDIMSSGPWSQIYLRIHQPVSEAIKIYLAGSPILPLLPLQQVGYKIQMYHKGKGQFKWHCDVASNNTSRRQMALVLYLNDVEKGGETEFFYQQMKIKPKAGSLVIFPPFWTHLHCGHIPESDKKYILTSFVELT